MNDSDNLSNAFNVTFFGTLAALSALAITFNSIGMLIFIFVGPPLILTFFFAGYLSDKLYPPEKPPTKTTPPISEVQ